MRLKIIFTAVGLDKSFTRRITRAIVSEASGFHPTAGEYPRRFGSVKFSRIPSKEH